MPVLVDEAVDEAVDDEVDEVSPDELDDDDFVAPVPTATLAMTPGV